MMTKDNYDFKWDDIGDIALGRPNLGNQTSVAVYRLMQYTMRSVLSYELGGEASKKMFREAGKLAGREFCRNLLNTKLDFYAFIAQLQQTLEELGVGVLRVEKTDLQKLFFTFTVYEDLDCSGLPVTDETVCDYDEGFISGIMGEYATREFSVTEIDCWSSGARVCRFEVMPTDKPAFAV
jgi:predicted hydrocarbon binding protein